MIEGRESRQQIRKSLDFEESTAKTTFGAYLCVTDMFPICGLRSGDYAGRDVEDEEKAKAGSVRRQMIVEQ